MQTLEHIIFDMDGTLIDSSEIISNSINFVRGKTGLKPLRKDVVLRAVNDGTINPARYFYDTAEFLPHHVEWFQEYYSKNHHDQVKLYDGILELLLHLREDHKLSIATNAYRISALQILSHLDIEKMFDVVVCGDDLKYPKPHPHMLLHATKEVDSDVSKTVMVGDSLKDKAAADNAGMKSILVDWGFSEIVGACKSVDELKEILGF